MSLWENARGRSDQMHPTPALEASSVSVLGIAALPGLWSRAFVVGLITMVLVSPQLSAHLSYFDGGITASAGTFIRHGQLPYRDFWLLYGPLSGYLAAALTALSGNHVWVLRIAGLLLTGVSAGLGYRAIASVAPGIRGATTAVVATMIPVFVLGLDLSPWAIALALALAAICVAQHRTPTRLAIAGLLVGVAVLARLDLGAYAVIAIVVQTRSVRPAIAAAGVVVPVAIVFLLLVPLQSLIEQLIWYPIAGPQGFRRVPGPSVLGFLTGENPIEWFIYYVPVVLIVGAVARRVLGGTIPATLLGLLVLAALCRLQTVGRADINHAAQAFTPAFLLAAYVIGTPTTTRSRAALAMVGAIPIAIASLTLVTFPADRYDGALAEAASIVQARTAPDEPIFVGEIRNDRVWLNPLIVYYLADRPAGVRDTMYNPGVTTTDGVQQRMIDDLAANHVRYLVLDVRLAGCYETSNVSRIPGSTLLDAAIARDFRPIADLGALVVMASRETDTSPVPTTTWVEPVAPGGVPGLVCERGVDGP